MTRDFVIMARRVRPRPERGDREQEHAECSQCVVLARRHHARVMHPICLDRSRVFSRMA
jgi:hypothetical protein